MHVRVHKIPVLGIDRDLYLRRLFLWHSWEIPNFFSRIPGSFSKEIDFSKKGHQKSASLDSQRLIAELNEILEVQT